jgi:uncharacterized protein YlxW (UPF0749 family)
MAEDKEPPRPVIIKTEDFSPSVHKLVMSDNTTMYGCTWPGCKVTASKPASVGAHFKVHSGKAAQRRRGEVKPRVHTNQLQEKLLALQDQVQSLLDEVSSYEDEWKLVREKADLYDAIKGLLDD